MPQALGREPAHPTDQLRRGANTGAPLAPLKRLAARCCHRCANTHGKRKGQAAARCEVFGGMECTDDIDREQFGDGCGATMMGAASPTGHALHTRGEAGFFGGISAMPSMHITLAFLLVFAAWHMNRLLGVGVTIYALIIWFGSVHLAWHYFVDGLVGLIALCVIWAICGRAMGLYDNPQVIRATT